MTDSKLTRIGIFYDGSYFAHVSDYYLHHHERHARISIQGLHELIRDEVSKRENTGVRDCQVVEAHYFRGRFSADDARRHDATRPDGDSTLYRERKFEDALIKAGVTPHFLPVFVSDDGRPPREKGIDVWLALEAFDLAHRKQLNVVVLVTGDGDYVPLVRKLHALGTLVMVTAWDLASGDRGTTRAAQTLIDAVTHPMMMTSIIDGRERHTLVENLFVPRPVGAPVHQTGGPAQQTSVGHEAARFGEPSAAGERGHPPRPGGRFEEPSTGAGLAPRMEEPSAGEREGLAPRMESAREGLAPRMERAREAPAFRTNEPAPDAVRAQGWVANLPYGRDFGFIEPADGGERLFFHQTWVVGSAFSELQQGDRVEYTPESNPRDGRPVARRVMLPEPAPAADFAEEEEFDEEQPEDEAE